MTYFEYIKFYNIPKNQQTREDWLYSEWHHGRVYMYEGNFYSTATGERVK